jgi:hypothetical protein
MCSVALLSAIAHMCVFLYLHGRIASEGDNTLPFKTTSLPQSYVTTLSLVFVTIFRAALVASIGVCYVQCLWRTLRQQVMEVQFIEELFQIRANVLRLVNPTILRYTPHLFLIAIASWLIPIATIYPPGALVVNLETFQQHGTFNVSVIPRGPRLDRRPLPAWEGNLNPWYFEGEYSSFAVLREGACGQPVCVAVE